MFRSVPVSEWQSEEAYSLRIPIKLEGDHSLDTSSATPFQLDGHDVEISEGNVFTYITVRGFSTQEEAEEEFQRMRGAIMYAISASNLGITIGRECSRVRFYEEPLKIASASPLLAEVERKGWTHVDGESTYSEPMIIPEHRRIAELDGVVAHASITSPASHLSQRLLAAYELSAPEQIVEDENLTLAIELFSATRANGSTRARVIALCTVLEVLTCKSTAYRDQVVIDLVDAWLTDIAAARKELAEQPEKTKALNSLASTIGDQKMLSINQRLKAFAVKHAGLVRETVESAEAKMRDAYSVRCNLVHNGREKEKDIGEAIEWLDKFVPAALLCVASEVAGSTTEDK